VVSVVSVVVTDTCALKYNHFIVSYTGKATYILHIYRVITKYIQEIPVEACRSHFIHCILEPLMKERPKSDIILKYNYFLVAI